MVILLEEAAHLLEPAAGEAGIDLQFEETGASVTVDVDQDRSLVVVKGIVEQHGGAITVESQPGTGSTFHFTVPVAVHPG